MNKLFNKWSQLTKQIKQLTSGYEENIFLVAGLLLAIGVPLFFLWNPIEFKKDDAQARSVLQAVEIPIDDGGDDNGGGGSGGGSGGSGGGGGGGGWTRPNGQPYIGDDSARTNVGEPVDIPVLDNDWPHNGVPIDEDTLRITDQPDNGTVTINPDNTITYTPNPGFAAGDIGTDTFKYAVDAENGASEDATVRITVVEPGRPETNPDDATTFEDTPITIDVLANDEPTDGVPLDLESVEILQQPQNGTAVLNPDNTITYTPNPGYFGNDELEYNLCAENGTCDSEPVRITVIEIPFDQVGNQPPVANNDTATTQSATPVTIPALNNDFDSDGDLDAAATTITVGPNSGTASVGTNGDVIYTPDAGFVGTDTITYQISDNEGLTDTATITITVSSQPIQTQPPVANDDAGTTPFNSPITVDVLANDVDADNDINPNSLAILTQPTNGSAIVNSQNEVIYTPNTGYTGTDTFTYQIADSENSTDTATVTITVDQNPAPEAVDDTTITGENDVVTIPILDNDISEVSPLNTGSVTIVTQPTNGSVTVNDDGTVDYTPDNGYTGPDSFVYEVSNTLPNPQSDVATVTITVTENQAPLAQNDSATTRRNNSVAIPVLDNDIIPGRDIEIEDFDSITQNPTNGSVTFDSTTGEITYVPDVDFSGGDSFQYSITTDDGTSIATVLVNVQNPLGPDALDDTVAVAKDGSIQIEVLNNDTPGEGTLVPSTLTIETQPSNGVVSVDSTTGIITYEPDEGFVGQDSFTYEIGNSESEFDTATVLVNVTEADIPPIANDDTGETEPDTQVIIPVLDNDFDSADSLNDESITIVSLPENGKTTVNPDGSITYLPNPGYQGTDSFVYSVENRTGLSDIATVTVLVRQTGPIDISLARTGQVLGASEKVSGELARTGGAGEIAGNVLIAIGLLLASGFFFSLYFIKSVTLK